MRRSTWFLSIVFSIGLSRAAHAEQPSVHDRWQALEIAARSEFKKYPAPLGPFADEAAFRKAVKQSDEAAGASRQRMLANFKELLAEGLARQENASFDDHLALAVMAESLRDHKEALRQAEAAERALPNDPRALLVLLSAQLGVRDVDAAEKTLARVPDVAPLPDVDWTHSLLSLSHNRFREARRPPAISRSGRWLLDLRRASKPDTAMACFASFISLNLSTGSAPREGWGELALADIEREQRAWEALDTRFSTWIAQRLFALRIQLLASLGKTDAARELLTPALAAVRQARSNSPDDVNACLRQIALERAAYDLLPPEEQPAARQQWADSLHAAIRHFPDEAIAVEFGQGCALHVLDLVRQGEYPAAVAAKSKLLETLRSLPESFQKSRSLTFAYRMAYTPNEQLERSLARNRLVGKPAPPLEAGAWLNGSPLASRDLEGKVVLVDFWAVWCQPCLRALPHLAKWHRQFGDKGLVVIGVTRYYDEDWDVKNARPLKSPGLTDADEQAALVKFAAHHELPFHIALDAEDGRVSNRFGVEGIPQLVLIDRKGIVRFVHVGWGEAGAAEVAKQIETLLAE